MDTEKIGLLNICTQFLAELWARAFAPVSVDRILETNGHRVRVTVSDANDRDTKPLHSAQEQTADQRADA